MCKVSAEDFEKHRAEVLPGAAHFPHLEDPDALAAVLREFIETTEPGLIEDADWGAIVCATGFAVIAGKTWGRVVGITVILINAMVQFFYIPYYPLWAVLLIGLDVACIWALTVYNGHDPGY